MLYLVSTPIGNLSDLSLRAIETLRRVDLILCEDTRHSSILLRHHGIDRPTRAFHSFNEKEREEQILKDLEIGAEIALISDAGTPLISDPGQLLVRSCIERNIPYTAIPGPCSLIQALVLSGFEPRFQFIGFLPRDKGPLKKILRQALFYQGTTLAFESPQRLLETLETLQELAPSREIAIARELTKTYEECRRGPPAALLAHFQSQAPRGEIVMLIREGAPPEAPLAPEECIPLLQETLGLSFKEAIKAAAKLKGVPKSELYRTVHHG